MIGKKEQVYGITISSFPFRFCSECKSKVLKAYSILAGDTDGDSEKG